MSGPDSDDPADDSETDRDGRDGSAVGSSDEPHRRTGPEGSDRESTSSDGGSERDLESQETGRAADRRPTGPGSASDGDRVTLEDDGVVRWFLGTDNGTVVAVRDVASSVAIVALIGLILFGLSGVWPPLVAVESGSMEPNMYRGDLVFVVDEDRFVGDDPIDGTGVVTAVQGANGGHEKFGEPGDVIIFEPNGDGLQTPVIHRAHFWVEEGENWVETKANHDYLHGSTCAEVANCPADHAGFVTKGDANRGYDQEERTGARTDVVRPDWITGKAMFRVPWLGHVRLTVDSVLVGPPVPDGVAIPNAPTGLQIGFAAVGGAAAIAGSRRPGSW